MNVCVAKPEGVLQLVLNPQRDLGFDGYDVNVLFYGAPAGVDTLGRPLIRWTVNQQVGKYFSKPDVTLDTIEGQLTTALGYLDMPQASTSRDGASRTVRIQFETVGAGNQVAFYAHKTIAGIDFNGKLIVTNPTFTGTVGEVVSLDVIIFPVRPAHADRCTVFPLTGTIQAFASKVSGVPDGITPIYEWTISPNTVAWPPFNAERFQATMPEEPTQVVVTLAVSIPGAKVAKTIQLTPATPLEAEKTEVGCHFLPRYAMTNQFVNPFGPDDIEGAMASRAVPELHAAVEQLAQLSAQLVRLYNAPAER
jgi:hypothetical protein